MRSRKGQPLKAIQWATGGVGKAAIEAMLNHPRLELAGCWAHSTAKHGLGVGHILGREARGVTATSNIDDILAIDSDAVMYSPLTASEDDVKALLGSGFESSVRMVVDHMGFRCDPPSGQVRKSQSPPAPSTPRCSRSMPARSARGGSDGRPSSTASRSSPQR